MGKSIVKSKKLVGSGKSRKRPKNVMSEAGKKSPSTTKRKLKSAAKLEAEKRHKAFLKRLRQTE